MHHTGSKLHAPPQDHALRAQVPQRVSFCGLPLNIGLTVEGVLARAFDGLDDRPCLTTFVNPGAVHMARQTPGYAKQLAAFDLVLPDGIGIVWGWQATHHSPLTRLSFDTTSLALPVLRRARADGRRVLLIGAEPGVAESASAKLSDALPGLQFCPPLHGFYEVSAYPALVAACRPDVVICGMGLPRQEAVLLTLRDAGVLTGPAFTCGGYLDQLRDGVQYYPPAIDRLNLRWLYRLWKEPRRLWRRYLLEYPAYAAALAGEARPRPAPRL